MTKALFRDKDTLLVVSGLKVRFGSLGSDFSLGVSILVTKAFFRDKDKLLVVSGLKVRFGSLGSDFSLGVSIFVTKSFFRDKDRLLVVSGLKVRFESLGSVFSLDLLKAVLVLNCMELLGFAHPSVSFLSSSVSLRNVVESL